MAEDLKDSLCGRPRGPAESRGEGGKGKLEGEEDGASILCCFAAQEKYLNFSECFRKPLESFRQEKNRALFSLFKHPWPLLGGLDGRGRLRWEARSGGGGWRRGGSGGQPLMGMLPEGGGRHPSPHGGYRLRHVWVCYLTN